MFEYKLFLTWFAVNRGTVVSTMQIVTGVREWSQIAASFLLHYEITLTELYVRSHPKFLHFPSPPHSITKPNNCTD